MTAKDTHPPVLKWKGSPLLLLIVPSVKTSSSLKHLLSKEAMTMKK